MNNLNDLVNPFSGKYDRKIKEICRPLNDCLKIPYFAYYQFDAQGNFCYLTNCVEPADFYYSEKFYLSNPFFVHPDLLRTGSVITTTIQSEEYLHTLEASQRKYQFTTAFLMVEKNEGIVEGFLFGTKSKDPRFENCYFSNIDLLKKFNRYFVQAAAPIIRKMKEEPFNIHQARGNAFLQRDPLLPLSSFDPNVESFLKAISPLSPREMECLDLFRKGHSAQATAAKMGLSRRTVEHYFESIKEKLECNSKWDLLSKG
ncbi:MAG: helix-turn-helix transcriptional regulator [Parachlamydiaceae bacterium]